MLVKKLYSNASFFDYFSFLLETKYHYLEVEGQKEPNELRRNLFRQLISKEYYWFEYQERIFLLYFEKTFDFSANPFILLLAVPDTRSETWPKERDCCVMFSPLNIT